MQSTQQPAFTIIQQALDYLNDRRQGTHIIRILQSDWIGSLHLLHDGFHVAKHSYMPHARTIAQVWVNFSTKSRASE